MLQFDVVTLFPPMFEAVTEAGITGRARDRGIFGLVAWNPRDFARNSYRTVDDRPYGGGPGMVMMAEPLERAVSAARQRQAEIKQAYGAVRLDDQVSRTKVSMNPTRAMNFHQCFAELSRDPQGGRKCDTAVALQSRVERCAANTRHDHVKRRLGQLCGEDRNDPRVIQLPRDSDFLGEHSTHGRGCGMFGFDHLQDVVGRQRTGTSCRTGQMGNAPTANGQRSHDFPGIAIRLRTRRSRHCGSGGRGKSPLRNRHKFTKPLLRASLSCDSTTDAGGREVNGWVKLDGNTLAASCAWQVVREWRGRE